MPQVQGRWRPGFRLAVGPGSPKRVVESIGARTRSRLRHSSLVLFLLVMMRPGPENISIIANPPSRCLFRRYAAEHFTDVMLALVDGQPTNRFDILLEAAGASTSRVSSMFVLNFNIPAHGSGAHVSRNACLAAPLLYRKACPRASLASLNYLWQPDQEWRYEVCIRIS